MAEKSMKAGKYELVPLNPGGRLTYKHITSKPGQPLEFTTYHEGDVVDLTAEEAERLKDVVAKPGELARRDAARHREAADRAQARADAAEERARAEEKAAAAASKARSGSTQTPAQGEAPAGNASADDWRNYALANGATVEELEGLGRDELRDKYGPK